jgi:TonB-dependent SusC/RagA subfamily outer membrane receptor
VIAAWMLQSLAVSVLLGIAALLADGLCRLYRVPRRFVWAAAVAGAALLPVWLLAASRAPAVLPEVSSSTGASFGPIEGAAYDVAGAGISWFGATSAWLGDAGAAGIAALSSRVGAGTLDAVLGGAWLLLSVLLVGALVGSFVRFGRARRRWRREVIADTPVYVTRRTGPAVVGVLRPDIIVPSWLLRIDEARQRMVVLHEREHVRRGDPALLASAAVVAALLPWNLPVQWMVRRLRLAIELDCDVRVLAAGAEPRAYGAMLIDIASRTHSLPLAAAALADAPTELEKRILAMTWKLPRFRSLRAIAGAAAAAALVLVACDVDILDPALQDKTVGEVVQTAVAAEPLAARTALSSRYFVDGREVTLDDISHMPATAFAHVEVMKAGASSSGDAEIRLTTVAAAQAEAQAREAATAAAADARGARPAGTPVAAGADAAADQRRTAVEQNRRSAARVPVDGRAAAEMAVAREAEVMAVRRGVSIISASPAVRIGDGTPLSPAPLYIVDGVIISSSSIDIKDINALDIESIEIVKGPAAARLYGARGANGVVMITTRR